MIFQQLDFSDICQSFFCIPTAQFSRNLVQHSSCDTLIYHIHLAKCPKQSASMSSTAWLIFGWTPVWASMCPWLSSIPQALPYLLGNPYYLPAQAHYTHITDLYTHIKHSASTHSKELHLHYKSANHFSLN